MTDYAWMSVAAKNPDLSFAISAREVLDGPEPEKARMLDALLKTESGEPVPDGALPTSLFAWRGPHDENKPITGKLPHFSSCGGFWILTAEAASVFRQFDLGGCKLHPIEIFTEDRQTLLPGQYFLLDFDSWKNVFVPDASPGVKMMRGSTTRRSPKSADPRRRHSFVSGCACRCGYLVEFLYLGRIFSQRPACSGAEVSEGR